MKFTPEVLAALQTLKNAAENDFERQIIGKIEHSAFKLIGQRFGRLTVIERAENDKNGQARWKCHCDCGNDIVILGCSLLAGRTKSCGCLHREISAQRTTKHGMANSKLYGTWKGIKRRCLNTNAPNYKHYGGRGITICEEWRNDFQAFYDYVSKLEHFGEEGYTLDRINNDGNYEPNNLRWADRATQARNRRNNTYVKYNGEKMILTDASEKSGIGRKTLYHRLQRGEKGDYLFRLPK